MSDNETAVVLQERLVMGRDRQVELARQPPRVDGQRDVNRNPGQSGGQTNQTSVADDSPADSRPSISGDGGPILTSATEDPAAPPVNLVLGLSSSTLFKTLIGVKFTAVATLMFNRLQQQGTAPVVSPTSQSELTFIAVCLLLDFAFTIIGACLYTRFRLAAYICGSFSVLLFMLTFLSMMHISLPENLHWLVWATGGVLLLACAILFVMDLAGYFKCESRNTADIVEV